MMSTASRLMRHFHDFEDVEDHLTGAVMQEDIDAGHVVVTQKE